MSKRSYIIVNCHIYTTLHFIFVQWFLLKKKKADISFSLGCEIYIYIACLTCKVIQNNQSTFFIALILKCNVMKLHFYCVYDCYNWIVMRLHYCKSNVMKLHYYCIHYWNAIKCNKIPIEFIILRFYFITFQVQCYHYYFSFSLLPLLLFFKLVHKYLA